MKRKSIFLGAAILSAVLSAFQLSSQGTLLLRQPSISEDHIAFSYGSDIWVADRNGENVKRITSTQAVESNPVISPDGSQLAFSSNRRGYQAVFVVDIAGGTPTQLTWYPGGAQVRDWSPDGSSILFSSSRGAAPSGHNYLWTVSKEGGPASIVSKQWGYDADYSTDGNKLIVDRVSRWDSEWRLYRGGQNTPLIILDPKDHSEVLIDNDRSTDIQPLWLNDMIYFLSDRDGTMNIWRYGPADASLSKLTAFTGSDVKWLTGYGNQLLFERDGSFHYYNIENGATSDLSINIIADFPWAETKWENVGDRVSSVSLSPTGKRAVMEARGDIWTIPAKDGPPRNLTSSSGAADRRPIWSPKGEKIAWFSDHSEDGYQLMIADQFGMENPKAYDIGISKLGWEPSWSPDGEHIAFVDDDTRVRVLQLESGNIIDVDHGGTNLDRGNMSLTWSPDSKWLAYNKSGTNNLRKIMVWNVDTEDPRQITDPFADAVLPAWDRNGKHLYFIASTDVALASGWANTSSMQADPDYAAYVINLTTEEASPFEPKSDEEEVKKKEEEEKNQTEDEGDDSSTEESEEDEKTESEEEDNIVIEFENIVRRTMALPIPTANYAAVVAGPSGSVFIGEYKPGSRGGMTLHKYSLEEREAKEFASGVRQFSVSSDGNKIILQSNGQWSIADTNGPKADGKPIKVNLKMKLNRVDEWTQIFDEAWRYQRDYFYDKNMHGRDWDVVYNRYSPLLPFIRHRADLNYVLDQMNGELSVGHSFVFGGDYPEVESPSIGLLGADLIPDQNRWKIQRIYTNESWNPGLSGPLDRPGTDIKEGYYLVGINGKELSASDNPYEYLDGTRGIQTTIHVNEEPSFEGSWQETVEPVGSENGLRRRAWIEDNRRMVDSLSNGKLAYVWVPNTGGPGFTSFNRYYFAQQDKLGAVIDERFNGGGLLDDYMVDLMTRRIRAALTNEVPDGAPMRLPAGILGPKVLLINEMAGSGGDFFPWVFRQQKAGPLIGATTWGGLVKSSVHYGLIDGGALTAPDNAVFDPVNNAWIAENKGVAPDIAVRQDAKSLSEGRDPQLERAVQELLRLVEEEAIKDVKLPTYSEPAKGK